MSLSRWILLILHRNRAVLTGLRAVVAVFLACVMLVPLARADVARSSLPSDLGKTYGFYLGQKLSIKRIQYFFPALTAEAIVAQSEFDLVFKASAENIEKQLRAGLGPRWNEFSKQIVAKLETSLATMDQATAEAFIQEVCNRAKGRIESPVLETLLIYDPQFQAKPVAEFARGFTQTYRTKGHPKAKGVDFQIQYPRSWRAKEGQRPNVIQLISSENGRGLENIVLMVRDLGLPPGYVVTNEELDEVFSSQGLRDLIPAEGTFISGKSVVIDRHKGGMVISDQTVQRVDVTVFSRMLQFVTIYNGKMLFLQGMVGSKANDPAALQARFEKFQPLFMQIANSLVIQDQY